MKRAFCDICEDEIRGPSKEIPTVDDRRIHGLGKGNFPPELGLYRIRLVRASNSEDLDLCFGCFWEGLKPYVQGRLSGENGWYVENAPAGQAIELK